MTSMFVLTLSDIVTLAIIAAGIVGFGAWVLWHYVRKWVRR